MTAEQRANRAERVAIMTAGGEVSEEEAQRYCDRYPDVYGIREREESQLSLLP